MIGSVDPTVPAVAARIVEFQRAAYRVEAELIGFDGIPQHTESAEQVQSLASMNWRGAFDGGRLVGIIAWLETGATVDIDRLAVDPGAARRGHGRQLVQSVPDDRLTIVSTALDNLPARSLYESMGFEQIGETEIAPGVFLANLARS